MITNNPNGNDETAARYLTDDTAFVEELVLARVETRRRLRRDRLSWIQNRRIIGDS